MQFCATKNFGQGFFLNVSIRPCLLYSIHALKLTSSNGSPRMLSIKYIRKYSKGDIFFVYIPVIAALIKHITYFQATRTKRFIIQLLKQKRFYTRETLRKISILRLAKISTLYRDWLRFLN